MIRFLEQIRVLDLSRLLPGPYASQLLADLGARVLKVEQPGVGDYMRELGPSIYGAVNRNKRSLGLDIKDPRGRQILRQLVEKHDVLLEGFRPGVMERLGLDYETVRSINPGIIYCSLSGYGQTGPRRDVSGHDLNYVATAGGLALSAEPGESPRPLALPLSDLAGGLVASHAILAALVARGASGKGAYLDVALTDAVLSMMGIRLAQGLAEGQLTRSAVVRRGAYDLYPTRDGRHLSIGALEDKFWVNLIRCLGREDLAANPRFGSEAGRRQHAAEIREHLEPLFKERDLAEWLPVLEEADVPVAPVNRLEDLEADPQLAARGLIFDLPAGGYPKQVGYPARILATEQVEDRPPPALGQHTGEVLARELGCSADEIADLFREGVVCGNA